ncbi:hypothetical protein DL546_002006 [Coniochaeta pulveracea]|uniref:AB hydrolase-1 domain-containing protein n=1 Tax=Coniochaeta pulveracea TaxID=177199 RepID=A0A420Y1A6_9PEZI|nr:hypothetical protein DL546_002006 [Coniochaeta pulveracea]
MSAAAGSKPAPLAHPPHLSRLESSTHRHAIVEHLQIEVSDAYPVSFVPGYLHLPPAFTSAKDQSHHQTAAILLSGAGGGVVGPSSIYLSLACKLASLPVGIPTLRLDYRYPARNKPCCNDVLAAMQYLQDMYSLSRFVLVGWSFGGAPVFTVGGQDQRVMGCATVASQTAETEGIRNLSPRPVLLLHGTGDRTLSDYCSRRLYDMYGGKGERRLELFEGDNHALTCHARQAEELVGEFIARCAGVGIGEEERKGVLGVDVVDYEERRELMERGGDLRGNERTE